MGFRKRIGSIAFDDKHGLSEERIIEEAIEAYRESEGLNSDPLSGIIRQVVPREKGAYITYIVGIYQKGKERNT